MIEVDLKKVRKVITKYNEIIKTLEENNTAIIYNFNELNQHWQDGRITKLKGNVNLEEQRILNLEKNIKSQLSVYREIEKGYEKIGKQVHCNLNGQEILNLKLDSIISQISNIIERYNSLGDISFYPRAYLIYRNKEKMRRVLKEFKTIKKSLNEKFNEIREVEKNVHDKLAAIKIQIIRVNNYEREE